MNISKNQKKVFIVLSADYANIGDIAITIVQRKIIENIFPERIIVEIPTIRFYDYIDFINTNITDDDIITLIGGGNIGNIYIRVEKMRRYIIEKYPNNTIISFPQSIDFDNTEIGRLELKESARIYGNHPNLTLFAREKKSYNFMKSNFKNHVELVPDIVMYLADKLDNNNISRDKKISICFRNDSEKTMSENINKSFITLISNNYQNIEIIDTHLGEIEFNANQKEDLFISLLNKFKSSEIVVTDRLHGMIFALITKTPCIAFDNSNQKISSTYYTWLKDVPYIKFIDKYDEEKIITYLNELSSIKTINTNINFDMELSPLYNELCKYKDY